MTLTKEHGGLNFATHAFYYTNDLILASIGGMVWLGNGVIHIIYTPRFLDYAFAKIALERDGCICIEPRNDV